MSLRKHTFVSHDVTRTMSTSFSIVLSANTTDFTTKFSTPLHTEEDAWEIALINLETYHSFPNVEAGVSDSFTYSNDRGKTWTTIVVPEGSYELEEIEKHLHKELKRRRHWGGNNDLSPIHITGNLNTLKCELTIVDEKYRVDFSTRASVGKIFGFEPAAFEPGTHVAENTANILSVNTILVHCDAVGGSYVNGTTQPTLYSFFPNVPPGYKIVTSPHNPIYLPVTSRVIHSLRVWLTDQDERPLNLRGETVTMRLHLRKRKD